jgi:hypothetical protein
VRRNPQLLDRREIGIGLQRQGIREQAVDPGPAVAAGRQADAMDHDQFGLMTRRSWIAIRRKHAMAGGHPSGRGIDIQPIAGRRFLGTHGRQINLHSGLRVRGADTIWWCAR